MRPNVLHLISNFHQGGSERQALQLARLLKESDQYNIHLACMDKAGVLLGEAEQIGFADIPEYRLASFFDRNALVQARRLARYLRKRRIDLIQTHDFYSNILGMAAARFAGVRVRIGARRETFGWRTPTQKFVERRSYGLAHAIVANSEAVRRQLRSEGIADHKIVTIYNGIDLDRFAPEESFDAVKELSLLGLPVAPHLKLITIVANLRHGVKDHPTFLRAAGRVLAAFPAVRFVVAGEGELTGSMRTMAAQLGIEGSTFFTGRCTRVAELLAASDVCVLSSKAEGFSNSILEYMAAARPVVVTDVGGAREAVSDGETGYIVPAEADEAMAARILALLENPERARLMGKRGRAVVRKKFSCSAQLAATEALYDQLLAPHAMRIAGRLDGAEHQIA